MYTQRELKVGRRRSFEEGSSVVAFAAAAAAVAANRFLLFIRSVCVCLRLNCSEEVEDQTRKCR